ncbi:probable cytochrome P450 305a1 [Culicoides brevitarsis]|uniref:probable cytochrome P450 305a1 n=1 Tax=Culicoides brevitarsis TaxID=469753 RepID=UPI00307B6654
MLAILVAITVVLTSYWLIAALKRPKNYPPGPQWLPIVGNTPYVRSLARKVGGQHLAFEELSKLHKSPVLGLKLGTDLVVVALTYPIVKEVHNKEEFDGRPDNFFLRLRTMGTRLGITCTDGEHWAEHRNFVVRHLRQLGYGRQTMESHIQNQLNELLALIKDLNGAEIWPGKFLPPSVINVLWTFTTGSRISRNDKRLVRLLELLNRRSKVFDMSGGMLSQMPWMRFIAPEYTGYNLIKEFNNELHEFFMETIRSHQETYSEDKAGDDLIYAYIQEMKEREHDRDSTFTEVQLTMIILDIFIAGSQTTSITIDLALMMMVVRPDIQKKVFAEILNTIGQEKLPNIGDKTVLPYTEAFLFEVQRFFHIVPVSGPRRALRETTLGGYRIPKNTTILMGLRTVHMDKDYWGDPEVFRPERFLNGDGQLVKNERLMPFGQGRRRCLGDSLARACMFTFLVGILQKYEIVQAEGKDPPSMDLLPGITLSPKPYLVQFKSRVK